MGGHWWASEWADGVSREAFQTKATECALERSCCWSGVVTASNRWLKRAGFGALAFLVSHLCRLRVPMISADACCSSLPFLRLPLPYRQIPLCPLPENSLSSLYRRAIRTISGKPKAPSRNSSHIVWCICARVTAVVGVGSLDDGNIRWPQRAWR